MNISRTRLPQLASARVTASLAASLAVGVALLFTGCSGGGSAVPAAPASTSSGAGTSSPAATTTADIFQLSVGDCLIDSADERVSDVPTVDGALPHDLEVFHDFTLPDSSTYPGVDAVKAAADAGCEKQFAPYVGVGYDKSTLAFTEYVPTDTSWEKGDRTVTCVLGDPNGRVTGTLRGAAR